MEATVTRGPGPGALDAPDDDAALDDGGGLGVVAPVEPDAPDEATEVDDIDAIDEVDEVDETKAVGPVGAGTAAARATERVRPSRVARVVRAVRRSAPATRGQVAVGLVLVAAAVALPLAARDSLRAERTEAAATDDRRADAAELRDVAEADQVTAVRQVHTAAREAAEALAARNAQRERLAALGLSEETIDAFLEQQQANTELVEYRRDRTTRDVDRQAQEIPQMEQCLERAKQSVNQAFNTQFGNPDPPGPNELCRALLG